jgi:hypothetical protein
MCYPEGSSGFSRDCVNLKAQLNQESNNQPPWERLIIVVRLTRQRSHSHSDTTRIRMRRLERSSMEPEGILRITESDDLAPRWITLACERVLDDGT